MKRSILFFIILLVYFSLFSQKTYRKTLKLMGSRFDISVVENDSLSANKYINIAIDEISRIENIISSWNSHSETSLINKNAGIKPVKVSEELFGLIQRSIAISKLTKGAFDITYASMDKIWKFDGTMTEFPSKEKIKNSILKIGYQNIILNKQDQTVYLKLSGMKIGFGGIGKGFAADKAKKLLQLKGVKAGIINASGDMNTWGKQPNGKDWTIAITNPLNKQKSFGTLPITNGAVVTSGNYEKYVIFNNKRYTHIIDPRTGYPSSKIISATVFASSAELADALATSIFVMGFDVGLNLINQLPKIESIIIDENGKIYKSNGIKIKNYK